MQKLTYHVKAFPPKVLTFDKLMTTFIDAYEWVKEGSQVKVVNPDNNRLEVIGTVHTKDMQGGILVQIKDLDRLPDYVKASLAEQGKNFSHGFFPLHKSEYNAFFW